MTKINQLIYNYVPTSRRLSWVCQSSATGICNLEMEHLNRVCKEVRDLGPNKTPQAIERVSKCLDTVDGVIKQFDKENKLLFSRGHHKKPSSLDDVKTIVEEFQKFN